MSRKTRSQSRLLPEKSQLSVSSSSQIPFRSQKIRKITKSPLPLLSPSPTIIIPASATAKPLTSSGEISAAIEHLRTSDPLLKVLIDSLQPQTFKPSSSSTSPFLSLSRSILYQQLATKAAESIYNRFTSLCGGESSILPDTVLALSPVQLRQIGVSGRKASYLHDLATKYRDGILSDSSILEMDDDNELIRMLTMVKGIGVWSVHMFMIFNLHKPDVLPVGDLGVRKGIQKLYGLKELPKAEKMEEICRKWMPYRSVGSWYMWRLMEAKGILPNPPLLGDSLQGLISEV